MSDIYRLRACRQQLLIDKFCKEVRDAVVYYASSGLPGTVYDTSGVEVVFEIQAAERSILNDLRAQLKDMFPDLAVTVELRTRWKWCMCGRPTHSMYVRILWT